MKNYPEWVLTHKKKGTELRCIKDKYYLYQVHCVRENGKNKKITDKYLGRITEDGLIPPKEKIHSVKVYEYGLSCFLITFYKNIYQGLLRTDKTVATDIFVRAIITIIYGTYNEELFNQSFSSIRFNNVNPTKKLTDNTTSIFNRCINMMNDYLNKEFSKEERENLFLTLNNLYVVKINDKYYLSEVTDKQIELFSKYNVKLEI